MIFSAHVTRTLRIEHAETTVGLRTSCTKKMLLLMSFSDDFARTIKGSNAHSNGY
jgi:hypothetical protein